MIATSRDAAVALPVTSARASSISWRTSALICRLRSPKSSPSERCSRCWATAQLPSAVVPVTGLCSGSSEVYGGQCVSQVSLAAGQQVTYNWDTAGSSSARFDPVSATSAERAASGISASPNPFNPETAISFTIETRGRVSAKIYDASGRLVRTLLDRNLESGPLTLRWNGSAENGQKAASGAYFFKLTTPRGDSVLRLILVK